MSDLFCDCIPIILAGCKDLCIDYETIENYQLTKSRSQLTK